MNYVTFVVNFYLAFLFYGFIGWFYESNIWAPVELKKFVNRGFLIGPLCPIYGLVANMDFYVLFWMEKPWIIFFAAIFICCLFEYIVSWSFEKAFGQRWWDYSNYPFNLNGRISVYSGIFFGVAGLLLVKVIHPFTMNVINSIQWTPRWILALILGIVQTLDIIFSSVALKSKNKTISAVYNGIQNFNKKPFDGLNFIKGKIDNSSFGKAMGKFFSKVPELNKKIIDWENRVIKHKKADSNSEQNQ